MMEDNWYSMLLLLFTNIFIHIRQPSLCSRNIFTFNGVFLIPFLKAFKFGNIGRIQNKDSVDVNFILVKGGGGGTEGKRGRSGEDLCVLLSPNQL